MLSCFIAFIHFLITHLLTRSLCFPSHTHTLSLSLSLSLSLFISPGALACSPMDVILGKSSWTRSSEMGETLLSLLLDLHVLFYISVLPCMFLFAFFAFLYFTKNEIYFNFRPYTPISGCYPRSQSCRHTWRQSCPHGSKRPIERGALICGYFLIAKKKKNITEKVYVSEKGERGDRKRDREIERSREMERWREGVKK